ncbi:major facilitator superfamily multidrug-resistance, DHA1 sub-family [Mycena metata]|uniref:Major facilitator superfamily multidrug-resistance, DHA1 sub-family n=1 Tax=Mycena metata TaxID=1033252 RepID=A0AAD7NLZ0_9AGAR|nr:major facilitator superfamily multidrug-resistance, DHA1 sub-family [Mycena metata]
MPTSRTPIPKFQLFILLLIQFAEPMCALVIYPFIVQFVRDTGITGGDEAKTGFYAGLIESSFFLAECLTVYQFARLADKYGRRPVLMLAPLGLGMAVLGFGLSRNFWLLLGFRCAQGALNGNMGVARTVMSEISDPTNVADIFSTLQLMWSVGATTSPFIGGVLANSATKWPGTFGKIALLRSHPYLLPCAVAACIASASFPFAFFGLRETLPSIVKRARKNLNVAATESSPLLHDENSAAADLEVIPPLRELLTHPVRVALLNHGLLCLCDMAYDALFPLVYSTPIPLGGLGLEPFDIGRIMGLCGIINAIFQAFFGGRFIRYFGARPVFTAALVAFGLMFASFPLLTFLAQRAGRVDAAVIVVLGCQLGCTVVFYFSFASTNLFLMDATPNRASVGRVNGLGQMVGTIQRSIAPSMASSLFALSVKHNLARGYLVYIVLTGVALIAARCSLMLPRHLQSELKGGL